MWGNKNTCSIFTSWKDERGRIRILKVITEDHVVRIRWIDLDQYRGILYSGRKITVRLSYVTVRMKGKIERARGSKTAKNLSKHERN
jgi:hypothetical protein